MRSFLEMPPRSTQARHNLMKRPNIASRRKFLAESALLAASLPGPELKFVARKPGKSAEPAQNRDQLHGNNRTYFK
jgi:hypothetical protein